MITNELVVDLRSRINPAYADQIGTESHERRLCAEAIEALLAENEALKITAERLSGKINSAPVAVMDTRIELGICALTEEDFPALYALQGHRVALIDLRIA